MNWRTGHALHTLTEPPHTDTSSQPHQAFSVGAQKRFLQANHAVPRYNCPIRPCYHDSRVGGADPKPQIAEGRHLPDAMASQWNKVRDAAVPSRNSLPGAMPFLPPASNDQAETNALEKVGSVLLGLFGQVKKDRGAEDESVMRMKREWAAEQVDAAQAEAKLEREDAQRMVRLQAEEERQRRVDAELTLYTNEEHERRANRLIANAAMEEERTRRVLEGDSRQHDSRLEAFKLEAQEARAHASKAIAATEAAVQAALAAKLEAEAEKAVKARDEQQGGQAEYISLLQAQLRERDAAPIAHKCAVCRCAISHISAFHGPP